MRITESTVLFVSSESQESTAMNFSEIMDAVRGGCKLEGDGELHVFTTMEEAEAHHERASLLFKGSRLLASLELGELRKIVDSIQSTQINDLMDKCGF